MQILNHFNTSVEKALGEIDPRWRDYPGLIVCGSHTPEHVDEIVDRIRAYREKRLPFLGICAGHQLAWIEYCRNVLGIKDATSEEFGETGTYVVKKREKLKVGLHDGETWWSNFECVFPQDNANSWNKGPGVFAVPFHPEYGSSKDKPHPLLVSFLDYARK